MVSQPQASRNRGFLSIEGPRLCKSMFGSRDCCVLSLRRDREKVVHCWPPLSKGNACTCYLVSVNWNLWGATETCEVQHMDLILQSDFLFVIGNEPLLPGTTRNELHFTNWNPVDWCLVPGITRRIKFILWKSCIRSGMFVTGTWCLCLLHDTTRRGNFIWINEILPLLNPGAC